MRTDVDTEQTADSRQQVHRRRAEQITDCRQIADSRQQTAI
jgi:hypothetical protein